MIRLHRGLQRKTAGRGRVCLSAGSMPRPPRRDYLRSPLTDTKETLSSRRTSVESLTCRPASVSVTHPGHTNGEAPGHLQDQSALQ